MTTTLLGHPEALTPSASQASRQRLGWVDVAKGIGIVMVVMGHALDGVMSARLASVDSAYGIGHYLLYTFHMPLFFFLTGLFVVPRLTRDRERFGKDLLLRVVWPYVLWSLVYLAVSAAMAGQVNKSRSMDFANTVALLWSPAAHLWFLYAVFLLHALAAIAPARRRLTTLGVVCLSAYVAQEWWDLPLIIDRTVTFAPFYIAGAVVGRLGLDPAAMGRSGHRVLLALVAAMAWTLAARLAWVSGEGYWSKAAAPAAVLGVATTLCLASLLSGRATAALSTLGRASMAIFILHVLVTAGTRIALVKIGVADPLAIVALGTTAGVVVPLVAEALARRSGINKIIGLG